MNKFIHRNIHTKMKNNQIEKLISETTNEPKPKERTNKGAKEGTASERKYKERTTDKRKNEQTNRLRTKERTDEPLANERTNEQDKE